MSTGIGRIFRLGGVAYTLGREEVEAALDGVSPKSIEKYFVEIKGTRYPPKQVLATALALTLTQFTTMDANRILTALGFEIRPVDEKPEPNKTDSERLFEEYLAAVGLNATFEQEHASTTRRPDYTVDYNGREILFEVKEFRPTPNDFLPGYGSYDPYGPLREKINAARKKFQDFENHPCVLVLYNNDKPLIHLEWQFIYAAMLGNLGFSMPFDGKTATLDASKTLNVFTTGGKMHRYKGTTVVGAQNTTIGAIVVLGYVRIGYRRFQADLRRMELARGKEFTLEEYWDMIEQTRGTERDLALVQLRTRVHENPYTPPQRQLPKELFQGPYDERYGLENGHIRRLFAGAALQRLEDEERPTWERTEVEVLRYFFKKNAGEWHPSSLNDLGKIVTSTNDRELVLILRRLQDVLGAIELRKWVRTDPAWQTRSLLGEQDVGGFFYGETGEGSNFEVRLTPRALSYLR